MGLPRGPVVWDGEYLGRRDLQLQNWGAPEMCTSVYIKNDKWLSFGEATNRDTENTKFLTNKEKQTSLKLYKTPWEELK